MIKANELRLNNWVLAEGNPYQIKHISPGDEWEPIPLTPEILEKAGFASERIEFHSEISGFSEQEGGILIQRYYKPILTKIEFVHQLQNLYFALTGTELEINL